MSFFGKNIRKIRSIRKISQTEFASIFDISRASVGSYEEGRAEPKIDIINKIANHFSITIDELINKELTVNDLYHFDVGSEPTFKTAPSSEISFCEIPYIDTQLLHTAPTPDNITATRNICLPLPIQANKPIALSVTGKLLASRPSFLMNGSTLIIDTGNTDAVRPDQFYLLKANDAIYISRLISLANHRYFLEHYIESIKTLNQSEIIYCYPIIGYIGNINDFNIIDQDSTQTRLKQLIQTIL